jgi:hypothetical protein
VWRIAPLGSGAEGAGNVGGVPVVVRVAPNAPGDSDAAGGDSFASLIVEDGATFDRRGAARTLQRALKAAGDGGVAVIAPAAGDLLRRLDEPARAVAYGLGDGIFDTDFASAAESPYEIVHALLDLMHCVDASKHPWTAFSEVLEENKPLWALSQELEAIDAWPGGFIVSRRFGSSPPLPPPPFLPFEDSARSLPVVPDKVSQHTYGFSYELHFGRVRAAALAPGGAPVRLLEIGLGCDMTYGEGAGFPLWRSYFGDRALLTVLEFNAPCAIAWGARPENADTVVYTGDQRDRELLRRIIAERGPFDVVVDDGAHSMQGQTAAIEVFFPDGLAPGGVLAIEDLFTSHAKPPHWSDGPPRVIGLFAEIAENLVARGPQFDDDLRTALARRRGAHKTVAYIVEQLENLQCSPELCVLVRKK